MITYESFYNAGRVLMNQIKEFNSGSKTGLSDDAKIKKRRGIKEEVQAFGEKYGMTEFDVLLFMTALIQFTDE